MQLAASTVTRGSFSHPAVHSSRPAAFVLSSAGDVVVSTLKVTAHASVRAHSFSQSTRAPQAVNASTRTLRARRPIDIMRLSPGAGSTTMRER